MKQGILKIAHIDTERTWRGGEQQMFSLIEGLKAKGHFNLAVVRKHSAIAKKLKGLVPIYECDPWGELNFIEGHFLKRRFQTEQIDIIHAHTAHGVSLGVLAALGTKIPVVATRRVDFHLSRNYLSRWKYQRLAKIVAISDGVKNILVSDGIPHEKISVVPSGIDFRRYDSVRPLTKERLGVPKDCLLVGQVAALAPHKDQDTFLKAMVLTKARVPNLFGVIVGDGPLREELKRKAQTLKIDSFVKFLGFKENPLDYLAAFDVFCLSSKEEGLGTSLLDAMALRVPVVATNTGGIPELIENNVNGFLAEPQNPASLSEALEVCIRSVPIRPQIVQKGLEKAKQFDISHTINRMESIYKEMA